MILLDCIVVVNQNTSMTQLFLPGNQNISQVDVPVKHAFRIGVTMSCDKTCYQFKPSKGVLAVLPMIACRNTSTVSGVDFTNLISQPNVLMTGLE